jgi:anti-sigma factor RsiW
MNCEELVHYLSDYIDNNLDEDLRAEAEEHLSTCHNCHVVLDTTRKTILLYKTAGRQDIPALRRQALFDRLQNALKQKDDSCKE